jgi:integrase-like protein
LLADLVKRSHQGETVLSEKLTVGQYLTTRWLPVQQTRLRKSTYDSYRRNINLHVIPTLGERQLDRLTVEDVDVFYATLLTSGRKKKGASTGLSPKSVHNIHVMLNKALSDAARKGTVVRNITASCGSSQLGSDQPAATPHRSRTPTNRVALSIEPKEPCRRLRWGTDDRSMRRTRPASKTLPNSIDRLLLAVGIDELTSLR